MYIKINNIVLYKKEKSCAVDNEKCTGSSASTWMKNA